MSPEPAVRRALGDLRQFTPARVGLGRSGASFSTGDLLRFTLDHARARDAVHAPFDAREIVAALSALGLQARIVSSEAKDRAEYLRRPDLGRKLDASSRRLLSDQPTIACDLALVVADGLSPLAVNAHAMKLVERLLPALGKIEVGAVFVASGARVALGDDIGARVGARMMVMLIGERPGLSAPDSLGAYITYAPTLGLTDACRNCVSNIHGAGLGTDEAAFKIAWLVREGLSRGLSGIGLKDESGASPQKQLADATKSV